MYLVIAENEVARIARDPIVLVFGALILLFALTNTAGSSVTLSKDYSGEAFFTIYPHMFGPLSLLFSFLSMCMAISSIAGDGEGSYRVLISKPLYRRDIILGKSIGLGLFLLLLITVAVSFYVALMIVVHVGPLSAEDLFLRTWSFIFLLFLNSYFTLGLVMLLGILFSKTEALVLSILYLTFGFLGNVRLIPLMFSSLECIEPIVLYIRTVYPINDPCLFDLTASFSSWVAVSYQGIGLMVAEAVLIVLINSVAFNRKDV